MLEILIKGAAYVGWWYREAMPLLLWWCCAGRDHMTQELDKRSVRAVGSRRGEEQE